MRTTLVVLLITVGGAALLHVAALANRLDVVGDIDNANVIDIFDTDLVQRAENADAYAGLAFLLLAAVGLALAVALITWQWRAAKNAEALGRAGPQFGPGWSIGGWFIPFGNLVIPVLIYQDLWRASAPGSTRGHEWRRGRGSRLIGWSWTLFLGGWLAVWTVGGDPDVDAFNALAEYPTVDASNTVRVNDSVAVVGSLAAATAALLLLRVVVRLTRRLDSCRRDSLSSE